MLNLRFASHHFLDTAKIATRSRSISRAVLEALRVGSREAFGLATRRFLDPPPAVRFLAFVHFDPRAGVALPADFLPVFDSIAILLMDVPVAPRVSLPTPEASANLPIATFRIASGRVYAQD
jgi:hypothetical protein